MLTAEQNEELTQVAARRWAEELFGRLARRLDGEQSSAPVLRLTDSFAQDNVWREGLDVALENLQSLDRARLQR